jgi:hypothetical protein
MGNVKTIKVITTYFEGVICAYANIMVVLSSSHSGISAVSFLSLSFFLHLLLKILF